MQLVAFTGLKRSGKDTAGEYLCNFGYKRVSFASKLKEVVSKHFGCVSVDESDRENVQDFTLRFSSITRIAIALNLDPNTLLSKTISVLEPFVVRYGDDSNLYRMSYRQVLQIFGTDVCRAIKDDIWVECLMNEIKSDPQGKFVITDLRFDNEAKAVIACGGKVIKIHREGLVSDGHASEKGVSQEYVSHTVNNTTFEELYSQLFWLT